MTGLFREEALAHHTGARSSGDLLRVPPSWTRWTFAFLVTVFVCAAAYATFASVTVYAHGLAVIHGASRSVTVYFPERDRAGLSEGLVIRIEDPSNPRGPHRARVVSVQAEPVSMVGALAKLGIAAWPNAPAPSRLAVAVASLESDAPATLTADEVVVADAPIGEESLLSLLLPGFRSARGD
jgi:hypothetical protein